MYTDDGTDSVAKDWEVDEMPLVFLAFGNLFFLLYDFALTTFVVFYVRKIREKLLHIFK